MIGVDNDQVLERDAGGSIIQHWRIGEIENVLIPVIKIDKQKQIAQLIQQSFLLKNKVSNFYKPPNKLWKLLLKKEKKRQ